MTIFWSISNTVRSVPKLAQVCHITSGEHCRKYSLNTCRTAWVKDTNASALYMSPLLHCGPSALVIERARFLLWLLTAQPATLALLKNPLVQIGGLSLECPRTKWISKGSS